VKKSKSTKRTAARRTRKAKQYKAVEAQGVQEQIVQEPKLPVFEGKKVVKVLDSGHTKTHFHCLMEGGVTMHVPKSKFNA
jgi:hypothetical protein